MAASPANPEIFLFIYEKFSSIYITIPEFISIQKGLFNVCEPLKKLYLMKGNPLSKNNEKAKRLSELFLQLEQEVRILEIRRKYAHIQGLFEPTRN